jgi:hypothetical protein
MDMFKPHITDKTNVWQGTTLIMAVTTGGLTPLLQPHWMYDSTSLSRTLFMCCGESGWLLGKLFTNNGNITAFQLDVLSDCTETCHNESWNSLIREDAHC